MFIFSCDGTIKTNAKPLESDEFTVVLQHENEIEALFTDENQIFYCGMSNVFQFHKKKK